MLERSTDMPATGETPAGEAPEQAASGPARHFGPLFFAQLAAVGLVVALLALLVWRVASGNPLRERDQAWR